MTAKPPLGRLEKVKLRDYWEHEALAFTPWLAQDENLQLLGDAIGMPLEVVKKEASVGPFNADILCKLPLTDHYVLIENQIEKTDHTHLGQILTYAAGLNAVTIVWIAATFTDEHRAALDWLNRITHEGLNFFGLEIELWRIGDSPAAPKFNIVCKPNDWAKQVADAAAGGEVTGTGKVYLEYWTGFNQEVEANGKLINRVKPGKSNWLTYGAGSSEITLEAVANVPSNWVASRVVFKTKEMYNALKLSQADIESQFGGPVEWIDDSGRIVVKHSADLANRDTWPELYAWQLQTLEKTIQIITPRVKALKS